MRRCRPCRRRRRAAAATRELATLWHGQQSWTQRCQRCRTQTQPKASAKAAYPRGQVTSFGAWTSTLSSVQLGLLALNAVVFLVWVTIFRSTLLLVSQARPGLGGAYRQRLCALCRMG